MTQNDLVLKRLKRGPLTQLQAISELGVMRLGARVYDLRRHGHAISVDRVPVRSRHGKTKVARYSLAR